MVRVPTVETFQVTPNAQPQVRFEAPQFTDPGVQARQTGAALTDAGRGMAGIALDMQQQANQVRIDDAMNRVKESALRLEFDKDAGFRSVKGLAALEKPDGEYFDLPGDYAGRLRGEIDGIASGLSDRQRQTFMQQANGLLVSFHGRAMQHEADEFRTHGLSVAEGIQATALREIGLRYNDPAAVDSAVRRIRAETYRQAHLLGKSAEWQEARARTLTSHAHKVALMSALEQNDPAYADAYLKKYSGQMDFDDIMFARGHITKEMDASIGMGAASEVIRRMQPRIAVSDAERAFNIAVGTESNGRQFAANGQPLTSAKGAIGIAQVMPDTAPEAAKLAGLPWDETRYKTDPTYNKALGLAYFQRQLQDNGGDLAKAYAAYNAGPGRLADALKKAEKSVALAKNDPNAKAIPWLNFLPKETRDYVAKNLREFEAGQGQPTRPTFQEIDDQLRADPRLAGNPGRYKVAREVAERQFNEQVKALKQREDEAVATAMRGIVENGGRYSDLPVAVRAAVPPKEIDNLISFAQKIAKGDDSTSPWLYAKLAGNPDQLARMSDNEFFALRRELSEGDFKHFANERAKRTGAMAGSNGPGDLNTPAIKQTLDARLRMLNMDPSPKDDGGADAARIGGIRRFVDQYFMAAQREAGKKFNDTEVAQHLDALFAKNTAFRGWFSHSSGPMLGMKAGDIDGATRDGLKAAFKRQGIDAPTDAQLLNAYWNLKVARK